MENSTTCDRVLTRTCEQRLNICRGVHECLREAHAILVVSSSGLRPCKELPVHHGCREEALHMSPNTRILQVEVRYRIVCQYAGHDYVQGACALSC